MGKAIEQTLDSIDVAEMVEKEHKKLMRDIRRYIKQLGEAKIGPTDFFRESTYRTSQNKELPCYRITKKGCEFIAHKLTGVKGTIFTARYINRFHEMEDILIRQQEPERPWFIRNFGSKGKVMLFRDFKAITGIELLGEYTAWERMDKLVGGWDWNCYGWMCDNEMFKEEYGFDFGEGSTLNYLYLCGIKKAIRAVENDMKDRKKLTPEAKRLILNGVESIEPKPKTEVSKSKTNNAAGQSQIQIMLTFNNNGIETRVS